MDQWQFIILPFCFSYVTAFNAARSKQDTAPGVDSNSPNDVNNLQRNSETSRDKIGEFSYCQILSYGQVPI